jgi:hypothetical protein
MCHINVAGFTLAKRSRVSNVVSFAGVFAAFVRPRLARNHYFFNLIGFITIGVFAQEEHKAAWVCLTQHVDKFANCHLHPQKMDHH